MDPFAKSPSLTHLFTASVSRTGVQAEARIRLSPGSGYSLRRKAIFWSSYHLGPTTFPRHEFGSPLIRACVRTSIIYATSHPQPQVGCMRRPQHSDCDRRPKDHLHNDMATALIGTCAERGVISFQPSSGATRRSYGIASQTLLSASSEGHVSSDRYPLLPLPQVR